MLEVAWIRNSEKRGGTIILYGMGMPCQISGTKTGMQERGTVVPSSRSRLCQSSA